MDFDKVIFLKKFNVHYNQVITIKDLEKLRIHYLGKKGIVVTQIKKIQYVPLLERKKIGIIFNDIKKYIINKIALKKKKIQLLNIQNKIQLKKQDFSLPGRRKNIGALHPITNMIYYIESIFVRLGFKIIHNGFEIEDTYHNFDALNIPNYHPARQNQDTFWFDTNRLLRTQTSNMQIHEIKKKELPIKILVPGKVYRKDYDYTHSPMFHQVEGLIIDKNINFTNLKWIINYFLDFLFNKKMKIRFRCSYFPFTILSAEVDIMHTNNNWLEILGCGMVHPEILNRFNIDSKKYSGLAFGIGIERIIMLYYGIDDLRLFLKNDLKFLQQFKRSRYY
ncbi:phenylalanine--tRNA ligase subunit alpha [Buchnera aphidicola]|uniref:phenylalanine--tRNA ligase subunit alpha n=1 Tax=Buchnera aphidicola TaxID=9 RepID=UPI003464402D